MNCKTKRTSRYFERSPNQTLLRQNVICLASHLGTTVDGLSKPDVLLGLCASVPVLMCNACRVGVDAGLAGGKVTEDPDGIIETSLVGVNPVES